MKSILSRWKSIVIVLIVGMALIGLVISLTQKPVKVVTFDMARVKSLLIRQLAEHAVTSEKAVLASKAFRRHLNSELLEYAQKHHVVIIDKSLVLQGGKDITSEVLPRLAQAMRGKS